MQLCVLYVFLLSQYVHEEHSLLVSYLYNTVVNLQAVNRTYCHSQNCFKKVSKGSMV